jgi:hypothetical protein
MDHLLLAAAIVLMLFWLLGLILWHLGPLIWIFFVLALAVALLAWTVEGNE